MKLFMFVLISLGAAAAPPAPTLTVDPASLPEHWSVRDASEFAKLGLTAQRLVYEPTAGAPPLAALQIVSRPVTARLTDDPRSWTAQLMADTGHLTFVTPPSLTRRDGLRVYQTEILVDSDVGIQHHVAMLAVPRRGSFLIIYAEQTRDAYRAGLPAVRDLFRHVRPLVMVEKSAVRPIGSPRT